MHMAKIHFQMKIDTTESIWQQSLLGFYKIIQIQVEMDLNRNPNFWAFTTDLIKPDLKQEAISSYGNRKWVGK